MGMVAKLKIGSLYYMAKKNKAKYIEVFDTLFENDGDFTTMTTTFNDYDICRYFYKFHKYSYVYEEKDRIEYVTHDNSSTGYRRPGTHTKTMVHP